MKRLFWLLFSIFLVAGNCFAQTEKWTHASGPYGGGVNWVFGSKSFLLVSPTYNTLLRSTDAGDSWDTLSVPSQNFYAVTGNDSTLILETYPAGWLLSRNRGDSWEPIPRLRDDIYLAQGLSTNGATHAIALGDSIFVSNDDAKTWQVIASPISHVICLFLDESILYLSGTDSLDASWRLVRRSVFDTMWTEEHLVTSFPILHMSRWGGKLSCSAGSTTYNRRDTVSGWDSSYVLISSAADVGSTTITGGNGLQKSSDEGLTWTPTFSTKGSWRISTTKDSVFVASFDGIYRSTDFGKSWSPLLQDFFITPTVSLITGNHRDNIYAYTLYGGLFRSTNEGRSWYSPEIADSAIPISRSTSLTSMAMDGDTLYVTYSKGLMRSRDNGRHFERIVLTDSAGIRILPSLVASKNGVILAASTRYACFSNDHGAHWQLEQYDSLQERLNAIDIAGANHFYIAVSPPKIFNLMGDTIRQTSESFRGSIIYGLRSIGSSVLFSTNSAIYASTDLGVNWTLKVDSLKVKYGRIEQVGSRIVYTDGFPDDYLLCSNDSGRSFQRIPMGYGYKRLRALMAIDSLLIGGFSSNGVWTSTSSRLLGIERDPPTVPMGSPILYSNYPNPFNPQTTIRFTLAHTEHTTLVIYNMLGQKVATLFDGTLQAGEHVQTWDARGLASGVYFYSLTAGSYNSVKKLLLAK